MKPILLSLTLVLLFQPQTSQAQPAPLEGNVVHVSRLLRMTNTEPIAAKDYYIDLGQKQGVKEGDTFNAYREFAMLDEVTGEASSLMKIPVGELKVFFVGEMASIAKLSAVRGPDAPKLYYSSILMGDRVVAKQSLPTDPQANYNTTNSDVAYGDDTHTTTQH